MDGEASEEMKWSLIVVVALTSLDLAGAAYFAWLVIFELFIDDPIGWAWSFWDAWSFWAVIFFLLGIAGLFLALRSDRLRLAMPPTLFVVFLALNWWN